MSQVSLKKNAVYNTIKSLSSFLFPFITFYYASRVVGAKYIGRVNWAASVISYFSLIAVFGISTYAVRECSQIRDDKERVSAKASELFSLSIISTIVSLVLLGLSILFIPKLQSYAILLIIQSASIVFTTVGLEWINAIYEDYKYISIRSIAVSFINLILLFILVRSREDYYRYAFLSVLSIIIIGCVNFIYIRKYIRLHLTLQFDMGRYIRELVPFFVNEVNIVIYVSSDTTLLGVIRDDVEVGIYSAAVKIYTIVKSVFIAIFTVALPRLSKHAADGDRQEFDRILSGLTSVFILLALPAVSGIILYARYILLFACGEEYLDAAMSLRLLGIALLFAVFGGIVTRCINIPFGYERVNSRATAIAAVENIVLNIPAIYLWGASGAALTTVFAELTVLVIGLSNLHKNQKDMHLKDVLSLRDVRDALIGVVMIVAVYLGVMRFVPGEIIRLFVGVGLSVLLYGLILLVMHNPIVMEKFSKSGDT